jgi:hypothetical protein
MKYFLLLALLMVSSTGFAAKRCEKDLRKFHSLTYRLYFNENDLGSADLAKKSFMKELPMELTVSLKKVMDAQFVPAIKWEFTKEGKDWVDLKISAVKYNHIDTVIDTILRDDMNKGERIGGVERRKK